MVSHTEYESLKAAYHAMADKNAPAAKRLKEEIKEYKRMLTGQQIVVSGRPVVPSSVPRDKPREGALVSVAGGDGYSYSIQEFRISSVPDQAVCRVESKHIDYLPDGTIQGKTFKGDVDPARAKQLLMAPWGAMSFQRR